MGRRGAIGITETKIDNIHAFFAQFRFQLVHFSKYVGRQPFYAIKVFAFNFFVGHGKLY